MKNKILITNDKSHSIFSNKFNESYHSKHGAIKESEHVFIQNGFLSLEKNKLNVLEVGFGTGLNALLTQQEAIRELIKVNYHAVELYPLKENIYMQLNFTDIIGVEKKILEQLHSNWGNNQKIDDYFQLTKHHISIEEYKTKLKFDIIYFDPFSPSKQPEIWSDEVLKKMFSLLKENGFLVTYCAKGVIKRKMKEIGFNVIALAGPPGKRQMTKAIKPMSQKYYLK